MAKNSTQKGRRERETSPPISNDEKVVQLEKAFKRDQNTKKELLEQVDTWKTLYRDLVKNFLEQREDLIRMQDEELERKRQATFLNNENVIAEERYKTLLAESKEQFVELVAEKKASEAQRVKLQEAKTRNSELEEELSHLKNSLNERVEYYEGLLRERLERAEELAGERDELSAELGQVQESFTQYVSQSVARQQADAKELNGCYRSLAERGSKLQEATTDIENYKADLDYLRKELGHEQARRQEQQDEVVQLSKRLATWKAAAKWQYYGVLFLCVAEVLVIIGLISNQRL
jgi:chromosome segregation ATPase